jgi:hypothetical protein
MELLFVVIISASVGFIVTFSVRGRETYGVLLPAAAGAAVASVVWAALLWLGLTFDGTWIWVASLVAGGLASLGVALALPKRRRVADRAMLNRLSGGKA